MNKKPCQTPFNNNCTRPSAKSVTDVFYSFLSGLNTSKIGGNTSVLQLNYDDGSQLRCMVDPGDIFGDNRNLEHPAMVDCDTVIADMRDYFDYDDAGHFEKAKTPLDFIILSHSHRDHIGAISKMILMGYKMPQIYATPYTKQRLYQHLNNENIDPTQWPKVTEVAPGQHIKRDGLDLGLFSVSHSTPQSLGLAFKTPEGTIVHTCDWKKDQTLIWGPGFDEDQFKTVVGKDVSVLLMDSTGADSRKTPVTEHHFRQTLRELFKAHPNKRFVIATHPGFEENMASIAKVVTEHDKTLFVDSWSHDQVFSALHETGLDLSDHIGEYVDVKSLSSSKHQKDLQNTKPSQAVVLTAGVQGHKNAALVRAAHGRSRTLTLDPKKDIILLCGPNMPGQDKDNKFALMAELKKQGFEIYTHPDHKLYPHAHARQSEIKYMAKLAQPNTVIPVHGDTVLRQKCEDLLSKQGHRVLKAENGQVLRLKAGKVTVDQDKGFTPHFIGFETRTGSHWRDRDYVVKMSAHHQPPAPVNDDHSDHPKKTSKARRKPRLFGDYKRF